MFGGLTPPPPTSPLPALTTGPIRASLKGAHSFVLLQRTMHGLGWWSQANCLRLLANRCRLTAERLRLRSILSVDHQQHRAVGSQRPPVDQPTAVGGRPFFQLLTWDIQSFSFFRHRERPNHTLIATLPTTFTATEEGPSPEYACQAKQEKGRGQDQAGSRSARPPRRCLRVPRGRVWIPRG